MLTLIPEVISVQLQGSGDFCSLVFEVCVYRLHTVTDFTVTFPECTYNFKDMGISLLKSLQGLFRRQHVARP